jgi:hypothetical protein
MQALQAKQGALAAPTMRARRAAPVCRASAASVGVYAPPSTVAGANELQALSRISNVVPDTLLLETPVKLKAATVSSQVLKGVLASGQLGLKPFMVSASGRRLRGKGWLSAARASLARRGR